MYLNRLNHEQKELFVDLCIHAALSNNDFAEDEKQLLQQYCAEMQFPDVRYTAHYEFQEALNKLMEISSAEELKMIALELTALIISDRKFDEFEKKFMNQFITVIGLSQGQFGKILEFLNELNATYHKIDGFISEG